ncbi:MAG TPA: GNAT family N-acetyltransferase [Pyrinomonadaceae bacterium]|nr:GNAT family N-acetyltransferase [Pyrinomonadaceae bacterium]
MQVREAQVEDIDALAQVWFEGWRDAHSAIVPEELARARTYDNLHGRLVNELAEVRVVGDVGKPLGFSMTKDDELYQLYVSREARGTGAAQKLIAEVEERLTSRGIATAWLGCAIGNDRAARFYERSGWHLARNYIVELPVPKGIFKLEVWRYEKDLA